TRSVRVELPGRGVRERLVNEVADLELDVGVISMLSLHDREWFGAVGQRRVVTPGREQLRLSAGQTRAAHDQPLPPERGLDLRLPGLRVVSQDRPGIVGDQADRRQRWGGQLD